MARRHLRDTTPSPLRPTAHPLPATLLRHLQSAGTAAALGTPADTPRRGWSCSGAISGNLGQSRVISGDLPQTMMVLLGGKERTQRQWQALADAANFDIETIVLAPRAHCDYLVLAKRGPSAAAREPVTPLRWSPPRPPLAREMARGGAEAAGAAGGEAGVAGSRLDAAASLSAVSSPEITRDHPRSPEIARDGPRWPEMARDGPRWSEMARASHRCFERTAERVAASRGGLGHLSEPSCRCSISWARWWASESTQTRR